MTRSPADAPRVPFLRDPKVRGDRLSGRALRRARAPRLCGRRAMPSRISRAAKIASGFGFWNAPAGFDISQTLIEYSAQSSTFGRAFWVGLTQHAAGRRRSASCLPTHPRDSLIGIARLSRNLLVARLAAGYVELIRNMPLLLQLLFWYNAVLKALPDFARRLHAAGRRSPQQPRPVHAARGSALTAGTSPPCSCPSSSPATPSMRLAGRSTASVRTAVVRFAGRRC